MSNLFNPTTDRTELSETDDKDIKFVTFFLMEVCQNYFCWYCIAELYETIVVDYESRTTSKIAAEFWTESRYDEMIKEMYTYNDHVFSCCNSLNLQIPYKIAYRGA